MIIVDHIVVVVLCGCLDQVRVSQEHVLDEFLGFVHGDGVLESGW